MAAPGDFSFADSTSRAMLDDAYKAITAAGLWDFFKTPPPADKGYMFWGAPELKMVDANMKLLDYHSGASYAHTMRNMQSIACIGWDAYVKAYQR